MTTNSDAEHLNLKENTEGIFESQGRIQIIILFIYHRNLC